MTHNVSLGLTQLLPRLYVKKVF